MNTKLVVKTDQSGANRPIDSATNRIFNFQVISEDLDFWRAEFVIKRGSQSTNGVTATIYEGFDASGSNLGNIFLDISEISQSWTNEIFDFSLSGITLNTTQKEYSLVLTTGTGTGGNQQIFIKDGNTVLLDADTLEQLATFDPDTGEQLSGDEGAPPPPVKSDAVIDTNLGTGLRQPTHPCITFKVDLQSVHQSTVGLGTVEDFTSQKTLSLPDVLGNGPQRLLKHGDTFTVWGKTAIQLEKNYAFVTGSDQERLGGKYLHVVERC